MKLKELTPHNSLNVFPFTVILELWLLWSNADLRLAAPA